MTSPLRRPASRPAELAPEVPRAIPQAVILAAGEGSRLRAHEHAAPKPLTLVGGISLLERQILVCRNAGVSDIVVVVGYRRETILPALTALAVRHHVRITPAVSAQWQLGNGASVLAAERYVHGAFFLMMCDHLIAPPFLTQLRDADDGVRPCTLAVDCLPELVLDLEEATKVQLAGDRIIKIGKQLDTFDAVDTGVFLCRPPLFDALRTAAALGRHTLSDAVQLLANRGEAAWVDCAGLPWIDVDTVDDLQRAEGLLLTAPSTAPVVFDDYALPDAANY